MRLFLDTDVLLTAIHKRRDSFRKLNMVNAISES